jgi:hypothetical protein
MFDRVFSVVFLVISILGISVWAVIFDQLLSPSRVQVQSRGDHPLGGGDRTGLQHLVRELENECEHLGELGCTLSWIPEHATMDGKRLSLGEQNEEIVDT